QLTLHSQLAILLLELDQAPPFVRVQCVHWRSLAAINASLPQPPIERRPGDAEILRHGIGAHPLVDHQPHRVGLEVIRELPVPLLAAAFLHGHHRIVSFVGVHKIGASSARSPAAMRCVVSTRRSLMRREVSSIGSRKASPLTLHTPSQSQRGLARRHISESRANGSSGSAAASLWPTISHTISRSSRRWASLTLGTPAVQSR